MEWRNVVVGVWSYNTWLNSNDTNVNRMTWLEQAADRLKLHRDSLIQPREGKWLNADGRPSMILVAPEYMFAQPTPFQYGHQFGQERFILEAEKEVLLRRMEALSKRYSKSLVLAPGSTAYKKPLNQARYNRAIQQLNQGRDLLGLGDNVPVTSSGLPVRDIYGNVTTYAALTTSQKRQDLQNGLLANTGWVAKNKMYLLHRGKTIATYAKRADFHELLNYGANTHTQFVPGSKAGRKTVGGVTFGIEICYDHARSVLANTPLSNGVGGSEIHLICSAYVDFVPNLARMRSGGYVVHACNQHPRSGVWHKDPSPPNNLVAVPSTNLGNFGGGQLDAYTITVKMPF